VRGESRQRLGRARCLRFAALLMVGWPAAAAAQTINEFPIPTASSFPVGITGGPDGAVWFTENGGNQIGRITVAGMVTEYALPTVNSEPNAIAAGSDGALWFTEHGCAGCSPAVPGKIGRITTAGVVTEFAIPSGFPPVAITGGPDGALWFTEVNCVNGMIGPLPAQVCSGMIGRITTAGNITEYSVPQNSFYNIITLNGIAAGADGALWFNLWQHNSTRCGVGCSPFEELDIGRTTTAGMTTEFGTAVAANGSFGIAAGPDGALWFTELGGQFGLSTGPHHIGRITTAGAVTQYPLPSTSGTPTGITSGPDGALWFTEQGCGACTPVVPDKIGRITTTGVISEYVVSTANSSPSGITTGPDGALWFTENGGNKIGRFTIATLTVAETGTGTGQVTSNPPGIICSQSSNQCSAVFVIGTPVTLTASASAGSTFTGWNVGGCSGTAPCTLTLNGNTAVTANFDLTPSFTLSVAPSGAGMVTSNPSGINCGATCSASFLSGTQITLTAVAATGSSFAGWSGGGCSGSLACTVTISANTTVSATFVPDQTTNIQLFAAVLPQSRSVMVGGTAATAFATILNAGPGKATTCTIAPATTVPASFAFQTTDPSTNALVGTANTPVDIPQGMGQTFVIAFTPNAAFPPTNVIFTFGCANAAPAPVVVGVNALNLSASTSPVPDIVALAASSDPGYVDIPGAMGTGDFVVATTNVGSTAQITVSADTGSANVPVTLTLCQSDPSTSKCLATPAPNVTTTIAANATSTFGIFVAGSAVVPNLPAINRVFVRFTDAGGVLRGETSVAVMTK
jgi:virginiamycin B lyase